MRRTTLVLVTGLGFAIAIGGGASFLAARRQDAVNAVIKRCESENAANSKRTIRERVSTAITNAEAAGDSDAVRELRAYLETLPKDQESWGNDPLVCDQADLPMEGAHVGVQAQIVDAHKATFSAAPWQFAAFLIAAAAAMPWAWYFLLRRLAEVRAAISGNPPEK